MILIHIGTNNLNDMYCKFAEKLESLFRVLKSNYRTTHMVWSQMLPRGDKGIETSYKAIMLNNQIRNRGQMLGITTLASYSGFHEGRVPKLKLLAKDYLHPNNLGVKQLRDNIRNGLIRLRKRWRLPITPTTLHQEPQTLIVRDWRRILEAKRKDYEELDNID